MSRLVVVSNRIAPPDNKGGAGGLAVGVLGALKAAGGLWFGWSGETGNEDEPLKKVTKGNITWASFNLSEQDYEDYYCQFSNAVLWPAFHYRLDLVQFQRPAWEGYMRVNALLADKLLPLIKEVEPYMRDILRAIAPVLNGIPNRISLAGHTDDFPYANGEKGYSNWELSADRANASRRELVAGGLDNGKVLRVVGMAATMRLSDRGPDDAINRRISLLVLNKQAEQAILHENAESQNEPVSVLQQPAAAPPASVPTSPKAEPR